MDNIISWRLNPGVISTTFRTTLLSLIVAFMISIRAVLHSVESNSIGTYVSFIVAIYIGTTTMIAVYYFRQAKQEKSILIRDEVLHIPRFFFPDYLIKLSDIKSAEEYFTRKKSVALQLGRVNSSSIILEERFFNTKQEFQEFAVELKKLALTNQEAQGMNRQVAAVNARRRTKHYATGVVALAMLSVYIVTSQVGLEQIDERAVTLGSLVKIGSTPNSWYRILSSFFLHYSPTHLGFNLLTLALVGPSVTVIFGKERFVLVIFGSAFAGALLSSHMSQQDAVIGASGGILGAFAAYFLICLKYHRTLPGSVSVPARSVWFALSLQIVADVLNENVDIYSHIGGFLFGLLYAYIISRKTDAANAADVTRWEMALAIISVSVYAIGTFYFLSLYFLNWDWIAKVAAALSMPV